MPHCVCCRARTTDFVILPKLTSNSIPRWLTAYGLDANQLTAGRNVICSSHVRDAGEELDLQADPCQRRIDSSNSAAVGDSAYDQRLDQILTSMGNVNITTGESSSEHEAAPPENGVVSTGKAETPAKNTPGPSTALQSSGASGATAVNDTPRRTAGTCLAMSANTFHNTDHNYALPPQPYPTQVCDVSSSTTLGGEPDSQECAVCLQTPLYPIRLPCNHVFCFLCAKGFASQHGRCAYCRADIPQGYMNFPVLVRRNLDDGADVDSKYAWYYEGRNGWWQFEERHCQELEEARLNGDEQYELQVSGFMYVIDMLQMVQYRKDRPGRTRRIKRDHLTAPRKGVAGLREDLISGSRD